MALLESLDTAGGIVVRNEFRLGMRTLASGESAAGTTAFMERAR